MHDSEHFHTLNYIQANIVFWQDSFWRKAVLVDEGVSPV